MRDDIANLVFPVITYALDLRDRLQRNEPVQLANEQLALRELLLPSAAAEADDESADAVRIPTDYLGWPEPDSNAQKPTPPFLGILYGLVCWLDELFVSEARCAETWGRQPLEGLFYGRNDRDWKFWEQAEHTAALPSTDALEAYYLCVMLGFRGGYRESPDRIAEWTANAAARIEDSLPAWRAPAAMEPVVHVPPLSGRKWLRRMLLACGALLLCLIPAAAFVIARELAP